MNDLNPFGSWALVALDVLIVAFIVYRVYVLLSRTRAVQLLVGFGLILIADFLAKRFQLNTVSWLVTNVSSYLVIGLIVLLQPELRRLVAEMGRMPVFQWFSPLPEVPVDEIVDAVRSMASQRVGSIIAILREIRPQAIIDNAVQLDSKVSAELIETIFFKDTPLHDGAVFVEGMKIVAASCYLPMSHAREIKKTYGARHRAALGFSEESDAVIVVTSEETGSITLMRNGEMQMVSRQNLKTALQGLLLAKTLAEVTAELRTGRTDTATDREPTSHG